MLVQFIINIICDFVVPDADKAFVLDDDDDDDDVNFVVYVFSPFDGKLQQLYHDDTVAVFLGLCDL